MDETPVELKVEFLRKHLQEHYGVQLVDFDRLDRGVLGLWLEDGRHWVARVFSPKRRAFHLVEGDAAALRFLEESNFPAETCAAESPVSVLGNYTVLLTTFISSSSRAAGPDTAHAYGDRLGRLHLLQLPTAGSPLTRAAGSLHHYAPDGGGPEAELLAADDWLVALEPLIPASERRHYDRLRELIAASDACRDLPESFVHPDPVPKNFLFPNGEPTLIDWTGAGKGPRLASLAILVWSGALGQEGWSAHRVDAVVSGYRSHIQLEPQELERLEAVMRIRPLVFACWRYRHAVRVGRIPDGSEWWWPSDELTHVVAERAVAGLQKHG